MDVYMIDYTHLLCCFSLLTTTPTRAPRRPSLLPPHTYADSYTWGGLLRTALGCNRTSSALSRACMLKVSPYHPCTGTHMLTWLCTELYPHPSGQYRTPLLP